MYAFQRPFGAQFGISEDTRCLSKAQVSFIARMKQEGATYTPFLVASQSPPMGVGSSEQRIKTRV
jgi:hypothetical protein